MVIYLENVESFFYDHPEFEDRREEILERAQEMVEEGNLIASGNISIVFGDLASDFKEEVMSLEHIEIGLKASQKAFQE